MLLNYLSLTNDCLENFQDIYQAIRNAIFGDDGATPTDDDNTRDTDIEDDGANDNGNGIGGDDGPNDSYDGSNDSDDAHDVDDSEGGCIGNDSDPALSINGGDGSDVSSLLLRTQSPFIPLSPRSVVTESADIVYKGSRLCRR